MSQQKTRIAFGSEAKLQEALDKKLIDAYDLLCLKEGKIGWIDKDGQPIFISGSGVSDYNLLLNKPIANLYGTESVPIVLNQLAFGNYHMQGYYIYTPRDTEIKYMDAEMPLLIFKDVVAATKGAKFELIEDNKLYFYLISFTENDTCVSKKIPAEQSGSTSQQVVFVEESSLPSPEQGEENKLYVTKNRIVQYVNNELIDLSSGQVIWEEM